MREPRHKEMHPRFNCLYMEEAEFEPRPFGPRFCALNPKGANVALQELFTWSWNATEVYEKLIMF